MLTLHPHPICLPNEADSSSGSFSLQRGVNQLTRNGGSFPGRRSLLPVAGAAVMAASRRSSQQQQQQQNSLQSPPRNSSVSAAPPASPPMALLASAVGPPENERECSVGIEMSLASPDLAAPALASSTSFSTTASGGGGCSSSSSVSSPGSGAASPTDASSSIGGAFRELFEACRNGDVSRVKRLVDSVNVNAKDMAGRKSTPLHFAAGKLN